ncbi:hypothetical protein EVY20_12265, partial [Enterobacter hormaechei]
HEPPICARSVPKAALARPPPTRQTRQKGRLNFLYPTSHYDLSATIALSGRKSSNGYSENRHNGP